MPGAKREQSVSTPVHFAGNLGKRKTLSTNKNTANRPFFRTCPLSQSCFGSRKSHVQIVSPRITQKPRKPKDLRGFFVA
jgi:hypothetical protein